MVTPTRKRVEEEPPELTEAEKAVYDLSQYLYKLFPVPNHVHFEMLPKKEQWRIIGHGEVMSEMTKFLEEKFDIYLLPPNVTPTQSP